MLKLIGIIDGTKIYEDDRLTHYMTVTENPGEHIAKEALMVANRIIADPETARKILKDALKLSRKKKLKQINNIKK